MRSAAAAQLLGNGMKQAQQPQHKETKGCRGRGVDRHTPAFKNKQPVACPFLPCVSLFYSIRKLEQN